jgi:predicted nucleic acid-binding protein
MIAVDSSVLLELLGDGDDAEAAEDAVRQALARGPVVVCDVVVGEVVAGLGGGAEVVDALEEAGIRYSGVEARAAIRAGEMQRRYRERLKAEGRTPAPARTVPDFLVGAHALLQCNALITRDADFFRDYFKGLKLIVPKGP